ncbi:hypothetical protein L218DRAFT_353063 [Marasmius fiardii PR-910]|nr:hypothetical protein L218DRAFT_353063 [Marasmius fiardii PR-910]
MHIPHPNSETQRIHNIPGTSMEPSQSQTQSRHKQTHPLQALTQSRSSSTPKLRTCSTPGCLGLVNLSDSTLRRCHKCVVSDWKARKEAALKPNNPLSSGPSSSGLKLRIKPSKLNRPSKHVRWADGYRSSDEEDQMDGDEKQALEDDMRREEEDYICGWDSDLTDLEDSSDEVFESSDSEEADTSDDPDTPPATCVATGLKIRIPSRPRPLLDVETSPIALENVEEESSRERSGQESPSTLLTDAISSSSQMEPSSLSPMLPEIPQASPFISANVVQVEEDLPLVKRDEGFSDEASTSRTAIENDKTPHFNQTKASSSQTDSEDSVTPTSAEIQEPDTKPTPSPRIRITLSQLSKLRASPSSGSPIPSTSILSSTPAISKYVPDPSGRTCAIKKCRRALTKGSTWQCSPSCRAHNREYQRKRLGRRKGYVGNEFDQIKPVSPEGSTDAEDDDDDDSASPSTPAEASTFDPVPLRNFTTRGSNYKIIDAHDLLVPKARICNIRSCKHILPGPKDYKWKTCHRCREKTTRTRKIRQIKASSGGIVDPAVIEAEVCAPQALLQDFSRIAKGRCPNVDCGVKLEKGKGTTNGSLPECDQFLVQLRKPRDRDPRPRDGSPSNIQLSASNRHPHHVFPPEKPRLPAPCPEYLTLTRLLTSFHQLFSHFVQAQSFYVSYNAARDNPQGRSLAKFSFDGEFSSVAPDFQVLKRKKEAFCIVENVKEEIERLGRLKFDLSSRVISIAYGGFITRFACQNQIPIFLPAPVHQPNLYPRVMRGELEVFVLPVDTHRFFPGQRIIVRFRLVG